MQNAWLDDAQAGIKIARRNISYIRYVDDNTLVTESEEPLAKGETGEWTWNSTFKETEIMASNPITSWQIEGKSGSIDRFFFLGL